MTTPEEFKRELEAIVAGHNKSEHGEYTIAEDTQHEMEEVFVRVLVELGYGAGIAIYKKIWTTYYA